jgi:hypothetical protein
MSAMPSLLRFLVILLFLALTFNARADPAVGMVTKVQNQAQIGTTTAVVGTPVHMSDSLRTGANGRMSVTFRDKTVLTLGENARVVIDRYVFNPDESAHEVVLNATRGALRFAGGRLTELSKPKITVNTPVAAVAVRGTEFWVGSIDGQYGVLLLNGRVGVSNQAGAVELSHPGWGTDLGRRRER